MAADESGEKGMNLSAIVSIKAAKMLQRVDTPHPDPHIVAGEQLNCLDIQADRVALTAGTHLTKRHPCAESDPPEGEQPAKTRKQGRPDSVFRTKSLRRCKTHAREPDRTEHDTNRQNGNGEQHRARDKGATSIAPPPDTVWVIFHAHPYPTM